MRTYIDAVRRTQPLGNTHILLYMIYTHTHTHIFIYIYIYILYIYIYIYNIRIYLPGLLFLPLCRPAKGFDKHDDGANVYEESLTISVMSKFDEALATPPELRTNVHVDTLMQALHKIPFLQGMREKTQLKLLR